MGPEAHSPTHNGATLHGQASEIQWRPRSIARRSISIFSRRGTDSPEPKPPFIAQTTIGMPRQTSEKQGRWIKRKSLPADSKLRVRGTILNAVPPAKTIQMTPLEEEMATSPNEEILSAIGGTPTTPSAFIWPPLSKEQSGYLWGPDIVPLAQRTRSQRRVERNSRIGVWRDGVTHWDEETKREPNRWSSSSMQAATGFTSLRRVPTERLDFAPLAQKPALTVVIPETESLVNDTMMTTILQSGLDRTDMPVVAVAPASNAPKRTVSVPSVATEVAGNVSFQQPSTPTLVRPLFARSRASAPVTISMSEQQRRALKHSSLSSSSSFEEDRDSDSEQESSSTSLNIVTPDTTPDERERNSLKHRLSARSIEYPDLAEADSTPLGLSNPLPVYPGPSPTRAPPAPPLWTPARVQPLRPRSDPELYGSGSRCAIKSQHSSRSLSRLTGTDQAVTLISSETHNVSVPSSPTLSQMEMELETQISNLSAANLSLPLSRDDNAEDDESIYSSPDNPSEEVTGISTSDSLHRRSSVRNVMHPPSRAPTIPKRSRKRDWRVARNYSRAVQLSVRTTRRRKSESQLRKPGPGEDDLQKLRRGKSTTELGLRQTSTHPALPSIPTRFLEEERSEHSTGGEEQQLESSTAENVLLRILASVSSTADLFNIALINKGMYRVYKENEMHLVQKVTYNQSPPAWEYRQWRWLQNKHGHWPGYTPKSFVHAHRCDMVVIEALKRLILERCQTVIRRETASALSSPEHPYAHRFNDALWRIWCFCTVFGNGKGREEDVAGQLDWLKGGLLATNQDLSATTNANLDYDMTSVLLNPPECFAKGNSGGLRTSQLYDMLELWRCMKTLLEGYHYRTEQARNNGIFDGCTVSIADGETEEQLLEEWTSYLLTMGPKVVLEMAEYANDGSSAGFALAKVNGWSYWAPPERHASRRGFLEEPVSRLYEERVAAMALQEQDPSEHKLKEISRKRVATLAAEIKLARQSSSFRLRPVIDMQMEQAKGDVSRSNSTSGIMPTRGQAANQPQMCLGGDQRPHRGAYRHSAPPQTRSPSVTLWSPRHISPIIEDRVETFNQLSPHPSSLGLTEDPVERAVTQIVDMGFSASQARLALRMSDVGGNLRLEHAVDILLSGRA